MDDQAQTINQAILAAMDHYARKICFKVKRSNHYRDISYADFQVLTLRLVKVLRDQGITAGERVALAAPNSLEWMALYMATLLAGGIAVPLRPSLSPEVLCYTLKDSGARLVALDDEQFIHFVAERLETSDDNSLPALKTILALSQAEVNKPSVVQLAELLAKTPRLSVTDSETLRAEARNISPKAAAMIKYTAGERGRPKGAVFDQGQLLKTRRHMAEWFRLDEDDVLFTVPTWSYSSSLRASLHSFLAGTADALMFKPETIAEDMQQTSPTVTINMPYFFERFYQEVMTDIIDDLPEASQEVFRWAIAKGKEFLTAGSNVSPELRQAYLRADMTFFTKIRGEIGGRMRYLYSTSAPLPQTLADFFEVIGLTPLNVFNLTEAGGFPAVSRPDRRRPGSCGQVAPGFELRLAEDGEVLIRGETVMREYWQRPEKTQQMIDGEGWLHSGDIGYIDEDGYLYLTGRKQPIEVLSTGRKFFPVTIENALMTSPFVAQAAVFGDGRPYVSALIVPDLEAFGSHFQEDEDESTILNLEETPPLQWFWPREGAEAEPMVTEAHPKIKLLLDKVINEINDQLDRWERIGRYCLLDQALSPTTVQLFKLVQGDRQQLRETYAPQIELMYPSTTPIATEAVTQVEVSPERMRDLLEKENILDAWIADAGIEFLLELAEKKQIDGPSIVHICDIAAMIAQMENEERPLSTAVIVGDQARIARILPPSQIHLMRHDHIRRMRGIITTMAKIVDGMVLGYGLDNHGYVRGIHNLEVKLNESQTSLLWGPQFRRHATISRECQAMVFFVPAGGRQVRVFADGQLVGRYANGDWSQDRMAWLDGKVNDLAETRGYNLQLLQRVLGCAFQMSEQNLGAIFIIGHADRILEGSDASEIGHFAWISSANVFQMTDRELINFAKQDGATLIDVEGRFRNCMVLLRPSADTPAEIGPGKGARHSSAAKMSAEAQCLAIAVSQDGPITIYESGQRVLSV